MQIGENGPETLSLNQKARWAAGKSASVDIGGRWPHFTAFVTRDRYAFATSPIIAMQATLTGRTQFRDFAMLRNSVANMRETVC